MGTAGNRKARKSAPQGSTIIVLAEDDSRMRGLLAFALRHEGFTVIEAEDGSQLLEQIRALVYGAAGSDVPMLVVSDHRMPKCSGLDVLTALRRDELNTPFLLITAFGDHELHEGARSLGARVLDKPFLLDEFRTAVKRSLSERD